jgi:RNA polymerase-binding transcription factor DksA
MMNKQQIDVTLDYGHCLDCDDEYPRTVLDLNKGLCVNCALLEEGVKMYGSWGSLGEEVEET